MSEDRKRVLEMLAKGTIGVDEAERLLAALAEAPTAPDGGGAKGRNFAVDSSAMRCLRITVKKNRDGSDEKSVGIRIPFSLVKGGMRLGAMIPGCGEAVTEHLRKKGIDLDVSKLDADAVESALRGMGTMEIDDGKSHVTISYE